MMYYAPRILLRSRPMPHPTTCILPAVRRDGWGLRLAGLALSSRAVLGAVCGTVLQHTGERVCARVDLRFPYFPRPLRYFGISVLYFDVYPRSVASRPHAERRHRPFHCVDRGGGKKGSCQADPSPRSTRYEAQYCPVLYESTVQFQDRRAQEKQTGEPTKNKHDRPGRIQEKARRSPRALPRLPRLPNIGIITAPLPSRPQRSSKAPPSHHQPPSGQPARLVGAFTAQCRWATSLLPRAAVPPTTDLPPWPRPATRDRT